MRRITRITYHKEKIDGTMPTKTEILLDWLPYLDNIVNQFIDIGEPTCWSCGNGFEGKYDIESPGSTLAEYYRAWERAPLHRCHILPASLGGTNKPSNLFLMCEDCHEKSPDTIFCDIFFKWIQTQSFRKRKEMEIKEAFESLQIDWSKNICEAANAISSECRQDFFDFCENNISRHFSTMSTSTKIAAIIEYIPYHQKPMVI